MGITPVSRSGLGKGNRFFLRGWGCVLKKAVPFFWLFGIGALFGCLVSFFVRLLCSVVRYLFALYSITRARVGLPCVYQLKILQSVDTLYFAPL